MSDTVHCPLCGSSLILPSAEAVEWAREILRNAENRKHWHVLDAEGIVALYERATRAAGIAVNENETNE